jgi:hypothetical protein
VLRALELRLRRSYGGGDGEGDRYAEVRHTQHADHSEGKWRGLM